MKKLHILFLKSKAAVGFWKSIVFSILLTALVIAIDYFGLFSAFISPIFLTKIEVARSILSSLVGTYLTITTFTFSTILTVLSAYASSYSPRVTENFMSNDSTLRVLGMFVGGFLYSIVTLFFMKNTDPEAMVIASTVIILYSIVGIAYFVRFIFTVARSMTTAGLISDVTKDADATIDRCLKDFKGHVRIDSIHDEGFSKMTTIRFRDHGMLDVIDVDEILRRFSGDSAMLVLLPIEGDFLSENEVVARYLYNNDMTDLELERVQNDLEQCLHVGSEKMVDHDYRFSIEKLTEIALRAISPGINDPNTAIHCLRYMGVLLGRIAAVAENYTMIKTKDTAEHVFKLVYPDFHLESDLERLFAPLVHYGKEDLRVMTSIFEALASARRVACKSNREIIDRFATYALQHSEKSFPYLADRITLSRVFSPFATQITAARKILGEDTWKAAEMKERSLGLVSHRLSIKERIEDAREAELSASSEIIENEG